MEIIILLGLVVVVGSWYYFGKESRKAAINEAAKKSINAADETAKKSFAMVDDVAKKSLKEANRLTTNITQTSQTWLEKIHILKRESVADVYSEWLSSGVTLKRAKEINLNQLSSTFKSWAEGLTSEEQKALHDELFGFGKNLHFNLEWLTDVEVGQKYPELKDALDDIVLLFSLAYFKASQLQPELDLLTTYQAWLSDPAQGKNLEVSQKMFAKMVDERMVQASPELLLAPEKQRRNFVVQSVVDYSKRDLKAFLGMLNNVIHESKKPANPDSTLDVSVEIGSSEVIEKPAQKRPSRRSSSDEE